MQTNPLYKSIVNKLIETQEVSLPYLLQESDVDIDIIKEYDIFTPNELEVLKYYNPWREELIVDYFEHPKVKDIQITIPDDIKKALMFLKEQEYSPLGICYDIECENCFDYDADIELNNWINDVNDKSEKPIRITKLYQYMINNPEFEK